MGLAILPSRLKDELEVLSNYILSGTIEEIKNDSSAIENISNGLRNGF